MVVNFFCDVDGCVNAPEAPEAVLRAEVPWVAQTLGKPMVRTEEVFLTPHVVDFFSSLDTTKVNLWWLTGWKDNAPRELDPLLGVKSAGWVNWDNKLPNEGGKLLALKEFLKDNPHPFVWVDDTVTAGVLTPESIGLPENGLVLHVNDFFGLTEKDFAKLNHFFTRNV